VNPQYLVNGRCYFSVALDTKKDSTMKSEFFDDYVALHTAAIKLSTKMIAALQHGEVEALEKATKCGAIVLLQLGPLPDCQRVEILMQEREGTRHVLAAIGAHHVD